MKMARYFSLSLLLLVTGSLTVQAQYFQFSQYNFTKQRTNPAQVAGSDYASISLHYRNQGTGADFNLRSNFFEASYPIIARNGTRWSGIGLSFMDDRSGGQSLFQTQEAAFSYAINIAVAKDQKLSLGSKILYQNKRLNMDGLVTGSQYIPDRGFDQSLYSGENEELLRTHYVTLNLGLLWSQTDKKGNQIAYAGFSFFDFNKANDSFLEQDNTVHGTAVTMIGFRAYKKKSVSILPEVLYTQNSNTALFNIGTITRYHLTNKSKGFNDYVDFLTKVVFGRSVILGIQLHKEVFTVGLSYDFPLGEGTVANSGAIELGIGLRKLVKRSKVTSPTTKKSSTAGKPKTSTVAAKKVVPSFSPSAKADSARLNIGRDSLMIHGNVETMSERLKHKQDSLSTLAQAGAIQHEPYVLEKATLHFNFEFNSSVLDQLSTTYLEDLSKALQDNPQLRIKLIGHTDNVGSDKFNLKLSIYRAEALKDFIVSKGVDPNRIVVEGKGLREPLNGNKTEEERALNRRVELTIYYEEY